MARQRGLPEMYRPSVEDAEWFVKYWHNRKGLNQLGFALMEVRDLLMVE